MSKFGQKSIGKITTALKPLANRARQQPFEVKAIAAGELIVCLFGAVILQWPLVLLGVVLAVAILTSE